MSKKIGVLLFNLQWDTWDDLLKVVIKCCKVSHYLAVTTQLHFSIITPWQLAEMGIMDELLCCKSFRYKDLTVNCDSLGESFPNGPNFSGWWMSIIHEENVHSIISSVDNGTIRIRGTYWQWNIYIYIHTYNLIYNTYIYIQLYAHIYIEYQWVHDGW